MALKGFKSAVLTQKRKVPTKLDIGNKIILETGLNFE